MNIHDAEGRHNALCMAASEGHLAVMAFLIEHEVAKGTRTLAEILDTPCKSHLPLIHHAVRASHIDVVRFLVREMGVDITHRPEPCDRGNYREVHAYGTCYRINTQPFSGMWPCWSGFSRKEVCRSMQ